MSIRQNGVGTVFFRADAILLKGHDQLRVALIELALFDAIDELLNLGRISGEDIIVVFS